LSKLIIVYQNNIIILLKFIKKNIT